MGYGHSMDLRQRIIGAVKAGAFRPTGRPALCDQSRQRH